MTPVDLVLFDIDGTLLLDDAHVHGDAMIAAARATFGIPLGDDAVVATHPHGRTDPEIALAMLDAAGVDEATARAGLDRWRRAAEERFARDAPRRCDRWHVRPGLADAAAALRAAGRTLGVVTGNLEGIARLKLELIGLAELGRGPSAFGIDAADRAGLVAAACRRANRPPRSAVVVGDTPRDIAAARQAGTRVVCFPGTTFDDDALAAADAVIPGAGELAAAVAALA